MQRQKNTHLRLSTVSLACLGWWLLIAGAVSAQQASRVVVEAGDLRLVFEKAEAGLRLLRLTDTAAGQELLN